MKRLTQSIVHRWIPRHDQINDPDVRNRYGALEGWVSIVVNLILFAAKGSLGLITGSVSLIADAFHSLSDVSTSVVVLTSFHIARKPSDASHPFGHGRMETIATVIIAVLLIVTGVELFKEGIQRIWHPRPFDAPWIVIVIIALTVAVKEALALFSRELGRIIDSASLEADFWHHRTDAISSVLVILAFIGQRLNISFLDGLFGVAVAGMIAFTGWRIAKKGVDDLLGKSPPLHFVEQLRNTVRSMPEIVGVHDIIVHQYGHHMVLSLHIEIPEEMPLKHAHTLAEKVENKISETFHAHTTVHLDPINTRDPEVTAMREIVRERLKACGGNCAFHDLRISEGDSVKHVGFDLRVDPRMRQGEIDYLTDGLRRALSARFPDVEDITIEVEPKYVL